MRAPMLIVGQGVAGTLLAWECERAGIEFEIADAGHASAASRVGAGIVNPITGQRLVKSWQIDALLGATETTYRGLAEALGIPLIRRMRVWRSFRDADERAIFHTRWDRGELVPYARTAAGDAAGFWIEGALHIDLPGLISAARRRWLAQGRLTERRVRLDDERGHRDLVVLCTGAAESRLGAVALDRVKGEALRVTPLEPLADPEVIRNQGHWFLPLADGDALVGATYDRAAKDLSPSPASRALLESSAARLLGSARFSVSDHLCGWRTSVRDLRPVTGRFPGEPGFGFINGLGSKGALYAPWLARQWINHLTEGVPFDPGVDFARFR